MMLWKIPITLEQLKPWFEGDDMIAHLGIECVEVTDHYLVARMPVDHRTRQSFGILHGGASAVLAETIGSIAGNLCVDLQKFYCIGVSIYTEHLRSIRSGYVYAKTHPIHLGKTIQRWQIPITDEKDQLISLSVLVLAVKAHNGAINHPVIEAVRKIYPHLSWKSQ